MAEQQNGRITETGPRARQAERGPTVFNLLTVSTVAAIVILAVVWFVFFKT